MREHVFTDARLAKLAGRFVWLEMNGEEERTAAFFEQFEVAAWPTVFVIDPDGPSAVVKWVGSANAVQLRTILEDALKSASDPADAQTAALLRGDRLGAKGDAAGAQAAYREALTTAPADWPRRPRAVESLVLSLAMSGHDAECAAAAREQAAPLPRGPSFANAVATGLGCALSLEGEAQKEALAALDPLLEEAVALPELLGDDRAGIHELLTAAAEARGDAALEKARAERWWSFLEEETARARTPEARAIFDNSRVNAALTLGDPGRALPRLLASEKALPKNLDAPYRLATLYRELGRWPEALAANARAMKHTPGPRRLRVYQQRATILERKGDVAEARRALEQGIAFEARLPKAQRNPGLVAELRAKLQKLSEVGG